jgi:hypothetical protein
LTGLHDLQEKVSFHRSDCSNNRIAGDALSSVVVAIFAEHSTLLPSSTILLKAE